MKQIYKAIMLLVVLGAAKVTFAAQQKDNKGVTNQKKQPNVNVNSNKATNNQLPPLMEVNNKPKVKFKKLGPKQMEKVVLNAGKEVTAETAMAFQVMKNIGLNANYGFGGISTGTVYTHYGVLRIPMLGQDTKFVKHWNTIHAGMTEEEKGWKQEFTYPDIFLELFTVRGKDAIKNWALRDQKVDDHKADITKFKLNEDAKLEVAKKTAIFDLEKRKKEAEFNRQERIKEDARNEELTKKWWERFANGLAAWPQYKAQVKLILLYAGIFISLLYLCYVIIYSGVPALISYIFGIKPIIVKEERLSWRLWGTNRVLWHSRRVKSNMNELHYAEDTKRWVDKSVAREKKRVAANRKKKGEFNFDTILLKGPPGTGKTALAKAWAAEVDMDFIHVGASSWLQLSEAAAIDDFKKTIRRANNNPIPVTIFIDEIDVLFPGRIGATGVSRNVTSTFLEEIDSKYNANIKFIFATNLREQLSSAIISRCGKEIEVLSPTEANCQRIYATYMDKYCKKHGLTYEKVDIELVGLTGRDIDYVCLMLAEDTRLDGRKIVRAEDIVSEFNVQLVQKKEQPKAQERKKDVTRLPEKEIKRSTGEDIKTEANEEIKSAGERNTGGSWPIEYIVGGIIAIIFVLFAIFFLLRRKKEEF